ncbi:MAG: photosynthetic complex assembly protein PuhC [Pseudomonadota bacterium]
MSASDPTRTEPAKSGDHIPPVLVRGAAVIVVFALVLTTVASVVAPPERGAPVTEAEIVASRDIEFRPTADNGVVVWDVAGQAPIVTFQGKEGGFIRVVERALAFERGRRAKIDDAAPFRLTAHADGRLAIRDLATGRVIDINAFGPANAEAFAALL